MIFFMDLQVPTHFYKYAYIFLMEFTRAPRAEPVS